MKGILNLMKSNQRYRQTLATSVRTEMAIQRHINHEVGF